MTDEVNSNINRNIYNNLSNDELIEVILGLKGEITKLNDDFKKVTNLRLYHLERNHNIYMQYGRRESFEIVGIPQDIPDDRLEDEVIEIMKEAKVLVNRQPLKKMDIAAVHRLGNKKTTIVRVVNRKFSREALVNGRNLKGSKRYGENKIFVNNSFCVEFRFLNFVIRKAAREKLLNRYKIRNGVTYVQMDTEGDFIEIAHVLDLENLGIPIPPRRNSKS